MWGQSAHVSQLRPDAPSRRPTAGPFRSTVETAGTVAPQPTETQLRHAASVPPLATRTAIELRHSYVNLGLIICPLISGLFFGLVATLLRLVSGDAGHAFEVGALAGAAIFAANALALCIVVSTTTENRPIPHAPSHEYDATGARAS
jgi:hypothetical protein